MGATSHAPRAARPTATPASSRKRKNADHNHGDASQSSPSKINRKAYAQAKASPSADHYDASSSTPPKKARPDRPATGSTEKRLRRFRAQPPKAFDDIYLRATTQRFYVLSRTRAGTPDCPEETVELTGSTGNLYTVTIARQPTCNCPHAREGNQCKHVVYVLARVLRARHELVYQLALLSDELREVFAGAPPVEAGVRGGGGGGGDADGRRKPIEGDCPICFCEMEEGGQGAEAVVWCRAACGQNIHKGCFETWAATKRKQSGTGGQVTCPYCRSVWEGDEDMIKAIVADGKLNHEGYVNVASQLGISTQRDHSTYSRWWSGHPRSYRSRYY
ncbi:hypothetical protein VTJ83DRAFT_3654 [Remersonia thermophila]|uniref:Znf1 n=1 Tax=Remersonia thermophila TaxID=72144 RepID=A0ABR4DEK8_9PEZI